MSNWVLEAHGLGKDFIDSGHVTHILDNLELKIPQGQCIGIVGRSGSGKTTLLQLLAGLDKPTRGAVLLKGQNLQLMSETRRAKIRNRDLGFVYQFHHLLPEFSALENVAMPHLIQGHSARVARIRALELLELVGLSHRVHHRPNALSGGERQRVAIARAIVNRPGCVLADEPTGNLDEENAAQVLELILKLQTEIKTTFVIVTHDEAMAQQLNTYYLLKDGYLQRS